MLPLVIGAAAVIVLCAYFVSLDGFANIERAQAEKETSRLAAGVGAQFTDLDAAVADYSNWDDTCLFVRGGDPGYPDRNLVGSFFESFRLNLAVFLDPSGAIVWGSQYDLGSGKPLPISQEIARRMQSGNPLVFHPDATHATSGSLRVGDDQWLLVCRPILDSDERGPVRGAVVFGRLLTDSYVAALSAEFGQDLSVQTVEADATSDGGGAAGRGPMDDQSTRLSSDGAALIGSVAVRDIYGQPNLVLRTEMPRTIYEQGKRSMVSVAHLLTAVLLILVAALIVILERSVVRPLSAAALQVRQLRLGTLARLKLTRPRTKELAVLTDEVNDLVAELALSRSQLQGQYQRAKRLADEDPLTGLPNRRRLVECLEKQIQSARRSGAPLSVIVMDFDDFKQINDRFGHQKGDEVLRRVGLLMSGCLRSGDLVGRYGGDEFVTILPGADEAQAKNSAERILKALAEEEWQGGEVPAPGINVMLSCGIASLPDCGESPEELIAYADSNLYRAKAAGGGTIAAGRVWGTGYGVGRENFGILDGLVAAINNKDRYTRRHSEEVASYAVMIAEAAGCSEAEREVIRVAALLHDVGKIGIPEDILRKPGALEPAERSIMERHVEIGALLIRDLPNADKIREVVYCHHERWDGKGYPRALKGRSIPLPGRILAVADAFAAITSARPYREARSLADAIDILRMAKGKQLDPRLVGIFADRLSEATNRQMNQLLTCRAR